MRQGRFCPESFKLRITVRYDVTVVKREFTRLQNRNYLSFVFSSESIGVGSKSIQFSALATPLFEGWIPQANGQTGSSNIPLTGMNHTWKCVTRDGT